MFFCMAWETLEWVVTPLLCLWVVQLCCFLHQSWGPQFTVNIVCFVYLDLTLEGFYVFIHHIYTFWTKKDLKAYYNVAIVHYMVQFLPICQKRTFISIRRHKPNINNLDHKLNRCLDSNIKDLDSSSTKFHRLEGKYALPQNHCKGIRRTHSGIIWGKSFHSSGKIVLLPMWVKHIIGESSPFNVAQKHKKRMKTLLAHPLLVFPW